MKTMGSMVVAAVLVLAGCGSSAGDATTGSAAGTPDFAALNVRLSAATGTFSSGRGGAIRDGFATQVAATRENLIPSASASPSGSTSTQSLHALGNGLTCTAAGAAAAPSQLCNCAEGGTVTLQIPPVVATPDGHIDETIIAQANACSTTLDRTVDGSVYAHVQAPPLVEIVAIHLRVTGKAPASIDVDYLVKNGVTTYAIDVDDGHVLVSAKGKWDDTTQTGTLVVVDAMETWTCQLQNGHGECTSSSGATRTIGK